MFMEIVTNFILKSRQGGTRSFSQQEDRSNDLAVLQLLHFSDLLAPQLEAVDVADVRLPRLLVAVGVVAVGAVKGHVHVLGLDVADDFALHVLLPARFANPISTSITLDEEAARDQVIIRIFVGIYIWKRRNVRMIT